MTTIKFLFSMSLWRLISSGYMDLHIFYVMITFCPNVSGNHHIVVACSYLSSLIEFLSIYLLVLLRFYELGLLVYPKSYDCSLLLSWYHPMLNCITLKVHNIGVTSSSVSNIMKRSSFDRDIRRVNSSSSCSGILSSLEFSNVKLTISSEVTSIIKVDIGISAGSIDSVVTLLGCELNITCSHKNKIIETN